MPILFPEISDSIYVRIYSAGYLELGDWWTRTDLLRGFWRLYVNDDNGAVLKIGDQPFELPRRGLVLVPPHLQFQCELRRRVRQLFVYFDVLGWPPAAMQQVLPSPLQLEPDGLREQLARDLRGPLSQRRVLEPLLCSRVKSLVYLALSGLDAALGADKAALLRRVAGGQCEMLDVLRYVDEHLSEPLDNGQLAEVARLSESCFIRRFKEVIGQTPSRYVQERRVSRASAYLVSTDLSIDDVAERCGFANRYYFSRVFSQRMGLPPARYRSTRPLGPDLDPPTPVQNTTQTEANSATGT
ncbi:MAG: AraC family transcriptional regulator [Proteobacteria bacterium]|nr:AraC family transcriptional regulator [Pseudomonadota bacterium]